MESNISLVNQKPVQGEFHSVVGWYSLFIVGMWIYASNTCTNMILWQADIMNLAQINKW